MQRIKHEYRAAYFVALRGALPPRAALTCPPPFPGPLRLCGGSNRNYPSNPVATMEQVRAELYKLSSLSLCSNTIGQLATGIMINPPKPGDPSFETFEKVNTAGEYLTLVMNVERLCCVDRKVWLHVSWNGSLRHFVNLIPRVDKATNTFDAACASRMNNNDLHARVILGA